MDLGLLSLRQLGFCDDAAADEESVRNVHGEPDFPAFDAAVIFYVFAKLRDEAALCEDL